ALLLWGWRLVRAARAALPGGGAADRGVCARAAAVLHNRMDRWHSVLLRERCVLRMAGKHTCLRGSRAAGGSRSDDASAGERRHFHLPEERPERRPAGARQV